MADDDDPILPWRDDLAPQFVRRRPARERWKDRTPADPPIAWAVVADLAPETVVGEPWPLVEDPSGTDLRAAAIIAGWAPDSWSDDEVVAHRRETRRARRRALLRAPFTRQRAYFVRSGPGWLLHWTVTAATAEQAIAPLRERLVAPPGWEVLLRAEPAGPRGREDG